MESTYLPDGMQLVFDDSDGKHDYYLDGEKIDSVTTILKLIGITKDIPFNENTRLKADFGTLVHSEIDMCEKNPSAKLLTDEARFWRKYGHPLADKWQTEVMFSTTTFAGRVDAIGRNADGSVIILDTKTGANYDYVDYQLSFYLRGLKHCGLLPKDLPDDKVELLVYDAKGFDGSFVHIDKVADEELDKAIYCYATKQKYHRPASIVVDPYRDGLLEARMSLYKASNVLRELMDLIDDNDSEILQKAITADMWIMGVDNRLNWRNILKDVPAIEMYAAIKEFTPRLSEFESQVKDQMVADGMKRARTGTGHLWTLSEYDRSTLSKDEILKRYPKMGKKIIEKCSKTTHVVSLRYRGKEGEEDA